MSYDAVRSEAMSSHKKRQTMYRRDGGSVDHPDEKQDKELIARELKAHVKAKDLKRKDGGGVEGRSKGKKADRPGKVVVNVIAPGGGGQPRPPMPMAPPPRPPVAAPAGPPPGAMPPRPMPPPGAMPGGMPPGGVPGMAPHPPMAARGGRMTAGAMSGEGRLEKAEGKR